VVDNEFVVLIKMQCSGVIKPAFLNRAANKKAPAQRAGAFTILNKSFMQTF
jgi:hypothetical protein